MKYWLLTLATIQRQSLFWNYENVVTNEDPADFLMSCLELDQNTVMIMVKEINENQYNILKDRFG